MRNLLIIPIVLIAIIVAISIYLQPNDLATCGDSPSSDSKCQSVDAIVAVSGGDTNARTDEAIKLFQHGWAPLLVFSGAAQDKTGLSNAAAMQKRAILSGVPETAIVLDEAAETTKQNAQNTQTILAKRSISSIILVTSGYHQRRASIEFTKMTTDVTVKNHPVGSDQDWSIWWWTNPRGWTLAVTELFKIVLVQTGVSS
jgi:uncharacterized SAM-binding protein YcdF (DUF218 family)